MMREIKFFNAIKEGLDLCMASDPSVFVFGLGVPDPKGIFGSTQGLQRKYGTDRVMDMPLSENGMTGVAIGAALTGMRPVMTHQRIDFTMLAMDQIVNQAANWHYMFGGKMHVPLVIRTVIGRGWGQGPQHSQSLHAWFAHVPGLKVVMPTTPHDAKGLLIASIEDKNPVMFIEHRWLYNITGHVPEGLYRVPLGKANIFREGTDITIVSLSHMTLEALKAAEILAEENISMEIVDVRTLKPLDEDLILESVRKTRRVIVLDTGWKTGGFSAEIVSRIAENLHRELVEPPQRIALPDCPTPTSAGLDRFYYPRVPDILAAVKKMMGFRISKIEIVTPDNGPLDVPDKSFTGPF